MATEATTADLVAELRQTFARFSSMEAGQDLSRTRHEWTYFAQSTVSPNLVKIGHTNRAAKRLINLQNACPVPLKLVGLVIAPRGTEFLFHELWITSRIHGEWFMPVADLMQEIRALPKAGRIEIPYLREMCGRYQLTEMALKRLLLSGLYRKRSKRRKRERLNRITRVRALTGL